MMDLGLVPVLDGGGKLIGEDLDIKTGDFAVTESTSTHQKELLLCNKGEFKQNPLVCVGAIEFIDSDDSGDFIREVSQQFLADGMDFTSLNINPAGLTDNTVKLFVDAYYK